jgi:hypothetical protein
MYMLLLMAGKEFNLLAAIIGMLILLVFSIPLGFLIAFVLRKWHESHPIEEAKNDKKPLGLG